MELYLEGTEPDEDQLVAAIRRATIASAVTPVLCGSAFKNKGVQPMLDAIVDFLPSPVDIPAIHGHSVGADRSSVERHADAAEPFAALAFKIMSDQHLGKLTYLRIYSGTLESGTSGAELHQGPQGADRQDLPDARQQARGAPVGDRRPDRGRDGPEGHHHRRHAVRLEPSR